MNIHKQIQIFKESSLFHFIAIPDNRCTYPASLHTNLCIVYNACIHTVNISNDIIIYFKLLFFMEVEQHIISKKNSSKLVQPLMHEPRPNTTNQVWPYICRTTL